MQPTGDHLQQSGNEGHKITTKEATVLARENNFWWRKISETIKIRAIQWSIEIQGTIFLQSSWHCCYVTTNNRVTWRPSNQQSNTDEDVENKPKGPYENPLASAKYPEHHLQMSDTETVHLWSSSGQTVTMMSDDCISQGVSCCTNSLPYDTLQTA